ncbi:MAG: VOC family protein [Candidatus Latescibacteria bacterium]|nr:VOC family protein [Candidatus Latescibacterota bacterium]
MARLRHLALRCRDVDTSRHFYEAVIGFHFIGYRSDGHSLDLSDGTVNITLLPHEGERPALEEGEEYIHFGILVDDLETIWKRLQAWGSRATKTVKQREQLDADAVPAIAFKTLDPDGNVIDISSDPGEWRGVTV